MPHFTEAAGTVVAADTHSTFAALDGALMNAARMALSFLEATQGADLAPVHSQKALDAMASGFGNVVAGRKDIVNAHRHLVAIKGQSNLAPVDFGCPGGGPIGAVQDEPVMEAQAH
ncbi:MAG: hypothetical protein DI547_14165 [Sphingobium sp.]|jgi:hypothetical protein|nr:MAG: hypothetical protein DI547_14165 [Sphingobium sp.]